MLNLYTTLLRRIAFGLCWVVLGVSGLGAQVDCSAFTSELPTITDAKASYCEGDLIDLEASFPNLSSVDELKSIVWYEGYTADFDASKGAELSRQTFGPAVGPCDLPPSVIGAIVEPCPVGGNAADERNEAILLWSGSGFAAADLGVEVEGDFVTPNGAAANIGSLGSCKLLPSPTVEPVGDCVTMGGPTTVIEKDAVVVVFTSSLADAAYDFTALCSDGVPVYVFQSSCDRLVNDEYVQSAFSKSTVANGLTRPTEVVFGCPDIDPQVFQYGGHTAKLTNRAAWVIRGAFILRDCDQLPPSDIIAGPAVVASTSYTTTGAPCAVDGSVYIKTLVEPRFEGCEAQASSALEIPVSCPTAELFYVDLNVSPPVPAGEVIDLTFNSFNFVGLPKITYSIDGELQDPINGVSQNFFIPAGPFAAGTEPVIALESVTSLTEACEFTLLEPQTLKVQGACTTPAFANTNRTRCNDPVNGIDLNGLFPTALPTDGEWLDGTQPIPDGVYLGGVTTGRTLTYSPGPTGCFTPASLDLTVEEPKNPDIAGGLAALDPLCKNPRTNGVTYASLNTQNLQGTWDVAGVSKIPASSLTDLPIGGPYQVRFTTAAIDGGCPAESDAVAVSIVPNDTAVLLADRSFTGGVPIDLDQLIDPGFTGTGAWSGQGVAGAELTIPAGATGAYVATFRADGNCGGDSRAVFLLSSPLAEIDLGTKEICPGIAVVSLADYEPVAEAGGTWLDASGTPLTSVLVNDQLPTGLRTYTYTKPGLINSYKLTLDFIEKKNIPVVDFIQCLTPGQNLNDVLGPNAPIGTWALDNLTPQNGIVVFDQYTKRGESVFVRYNADDPSQCYSERQFTPFAFELNTHKPPTYVEDPNGDTYTATIDLTLPNGSSSLVASEGDLTATTLTVTGLEFDETDTVSIYDQASTCVPQLDIELNYVKSQLPPCNLALSPTVTQPYILCFGGPPFELSDLLTDPTTPGQWIDTDPVTGPYNDFLEAIGTANPSFRNPNPTYIYNLRFTPDPDFCTGDPIEVQVQVLDPELAIPEIDISECQGAADLQLGPYLGALPAGGTWEGERISQTGEFDMPTPFAEAEKSYSIDYLTEDATCRLATFNITVQRSALQFPGAAASIDLCLDDPPFQLSTYDKFIPQGSTGSFSIDNVPVVGTIDPQAFGVGVFDLVFSSSLSCIENVPPITLTISPGGATLNYPPQPICADADPLPLTSFELPGAGGGVWSLNGTPIQTLDPAQYPPGSTPIVFDYSLASGPCGPSTGTLSVTIEASPTLSFVADPVCAFGGPVDLAQILQPAGVSGTWSGSPALNGDQFDPTGLAGPQQLTFTPDASTGCFAEASYSFTLNVVEELQASVTIGECDLAAQTYSASVSISGGAGTYTIDGNPYTSGQVQLTDLPIGSGPTQLVVADAEACTPDVNLPLTPPPCDPGCNLPDPGQFSLPTATLCDPFLVLAADFLSQPPADPNVALVYVAYSDATLSNEVARSNTLPLDLSAFQNSTVYVAALIGTLTPTGELDADCVKLGAPFELNVVADCDQPDPTCATPVDAGTLSLPAASPDGSICGNGVGPTLPLAGTDPAGRVVYRLDDNQDQADGFIAERPNTNFPSTFPDGTEAVIGQPYFVYAAAGAADPNGGPGLDPTDPCIGTSNTVTIQWRPPIVATVTESLCDDAGNFVATIALAGGQPPYTYSGPPGVFDPTDPSVFTNGSLPINASGYTYAFVDANNCATSADVTIGTACDDPTTDPPPPTPSCTVAVPGDFPAEATTLQIVCDGDLTPDLNPSGSDPSTYDQLVYRLDDNQDPTDGFLQEDSDTRFDPAIAFANGTVPFGTTLYIYGYAGDLLPNERIDSTSSCAVRTNTIPVTWLEPVTGQAEAGVCNADLSTYTVTINLDPTTDPIQIVQGSGTLSPDRATFTSDPIPAGTIASVSLAVDPRCPTEFTLNTTCEADNPPPPPPPPSCTAAVVGSFPASATEPQTLCADESTSDVQLLGIQAGTFAALVYRLDTDEDATNGYLREGSNTAFDLPDSPPGQPTLAGETLYVYAYAGPLAANGQIDSTSSCAAQTNRLPVVWSESVQGTPRPPVCSPDALTYTVTVDLVPTTGTVTVLRGAGTVDPDPVAPTFTSDPIPSSVVADVDLGIDPTCEPTTFSFSNTCTPRPPGCTTDAGRLTASAIDLCSSADLPTLITRTPSAPAPGNALVYVLDDDGDPTNGSVDVADDLNFSVAPPGVALFVYAVDGPAAATGAGVDFADPCTDVSNAIPVRFAAELRVTQVADCDAATGTFTSTFTLTGGIPPYEVDVQGVPTPIAGNSYTTETLLLTDAPRFTFTDALDDCGSQIATADGTSCNVACGSYPGSFATQRVGLCFPYRSDLSFQNDFKRKPGDGQTFVVYSDQQLTTELARTTELPIPFGDFAAQGQTVYVVSAVGTLTGGAVDLSCAQSSNTVAVVLDATAEENRSFDVCPGESYTFRDITLDGQTPTAQFTAPGVSGNCDTTFYLSLNVGSTIEADYADVVCGSDPVVIAGETFTPARPTGVVTVPSTTGSCDTALTVNLTFAPLARRLVEASICSGDTFSIAGEDFYLGKQAGEVAVPNGTVCDSILTVRLDVAEPPVVSIGGPASSCTEDSVQLTINVAGGRAVRADQVVNGNPAGAIDLAAGTNVVTVAITDDFTYRLQQITAEQGACPFTAEPSVSYQLRRSQVTAEIAAPPGRSLEVCGDTPLESLAARPRGGTGPFAYRWNNGETSATIFDVETGAYTVEITDAVGCSDTARVELAVGDTLGYDLDIQRPDCPGEAGNALLTFSRVAPVGLTYSFDGGGSAPVEDALLEFGGLAPGNYLLQLSEPGGCVQGIGVNIPEADLRPDLIPSDSLTIALGDVQDIVLNLGGVIPDSIVWSPEVTLADPVSPGSVRLAPVGDQAYRVRVVTADGCVFGDEVYVSVLPVAEILVPNVFSPNGDGNNDFLRPIGGPAVERIESFEAYDRWGNLLFRQVSFDPADASVAWDGTYRGKPVDNGVYLVQVEATFKDGIRRIFNQDVTLLR